MQPPPAATGKQSAPLSLPLLFEPASSEPDVFIARGRDAWNIAADPQGAAYLVGRAVSDDMPAPIARPHVPPSPNGVYWDDDAYVAKFNRDGTAAWVSFISGNDWDLASAVGVGPDSDVYVGGVTHSPDFPTTAGSSRRSCRGRYSNDGRRGLKTPPYFR